MVHIRLRSDVRGWRVRSGRLVVEKRRWSGEDSVFIPVDHLGSDEWGTWVLAPPLTPHLHPGGWLEHLQAIPIVGLIPHDLLYTAWFKPHGGKVDLSAGNQIDLDAATVVFLDVDLDVVWAWGSPARVVDQEEFDELSLPTHLRSRISDEAVAVCREIDGALGAFGVVARSAVADAVARHGDAEPVRDGFYPMRAGLVASTVAAFGHRALEGSAAPGSWQMVGMCDGRVVVLISVASGEVAVVALSEELRGGPAEDLSGRAAKAVAALPPPGK